MRPGPRNLITDVEGVTIGNADDLVVRTGVTVALLDRPCVAGCDVRGGAPGTRETDALDPTCLVGTIDAVVLSGGSAFGLDAAGGVMGWLAQRGRGFAVGAARVPIVPAAILFDLLNGGDKSWDATPPYRALGRAACESAGPAFALGNHGAGVGALAGDLKGGLGSASVIDDGLVVGALVAANPLGSAVMGEGPTLWAWALEQDRELGGQRPPSAAVRADLGLGKRPTAGASTTLAVVATNARLTPAEARRVAIMAQDGIARAVRPAHTPYDGDTVFALGTARFDAVSGPDAVLRVGAMAADCVARALARGIYEAEDLGDAVSYRSRYHR